MLRLVCTFILNVLFQFYMYHLFLSHSKTELTFYFSLYYYFFSFKETC